VRFSKGTEGWKLLGNGAWKAQDGALRQDKLDENIRAVGRRPEVDRLHLQPESPQARRRRSFLILFRNQRDTEKSWWNLGGWGNKRYGSKSAVSSARKWTAALRRGAGMTFASS